MIFSIATMLVSVKVIALSGPRPFDTCMSTYRTVLHKQKQQRSMSTTLSVNHSSPARVSAVSADTPASKSPYITIGITACTVVCTWGKTHTLPLVTKSRNHLATSLWPAGDMLSLRSTHVKCMSRVTDVRLNSVNSFCFGRHSTSTEKIACMQLLYNAYWRMNWCGQQPRQNSKNDVHA